MKLKELIEQLEELRRRKVDGETEIGVEVESRGSVGFESREIEGVAFVPTIYPRIRITIKKP